MNIEFDPDKDAANFAKHGVSLSLAAALEVIIVVPDDRYAEPRFRLYGMIDGVAYCVAATARGDTIRIINMRRAHEKELWKYAR